MKETMEIGSNDVAKAARAIFAARTEQRNLLYCKDFPPSRDFFREKTRVKRNRPWAFRRQSGRNRRGRLVARGTVEKDLTSQG
jgi:hypothetical protein